MTATTARRLAHGLWLAVALAWVTALVLTLIDEPSEAVGTGLLGLPIATYATVGALVARRRPEHPIGWLFIGVAGALALWMLGFAYAQAGLGGGAGLSAVPGATLAAWVGAISSIMVAPIAFPTFLLLFPDGHLRSPRWRIALILTAVGAGLMTLGAVGEIHKYAGTTRIQAPAWAADLPGIKGFFAAGFVLAAIAAVAGIAALFLRFRAASSDERQSIRLLVGMTATMGFVTAIAAIIVFASRGAEWSWIAIVLAFLVDGFGVLIGIPMAAAAAVLTYGLYDVGVVMKKTVVYALLVGIFAILLALIAVVLSPLALLGTAGVDQTARSEVIVTRILTGVAIFALVFAIGFRRVKRIARRVVYGRRATPYEAMAAFGERLGETYSTEDVLPRMAEIVRASTGAETARVWLHVGAELRPVAASPGESPAIATVEVTDDELPAIDALRTFPVRDRGELLGALTVAMPIAEPLSKDGEKLVIDLAGQAGLVLRNVRLIQEVQESRRRIVAAQDERARKLERDIHDGAQQQLVSLSVKLGLAEQLITRDPEKARALLGELKTEAGDAMTNLRDLARGIYPPLLADKGLAEAIGSQARKSTVPTTVLGGDVGRHAPEIEAAVYFCTLEALQNVAKYAHASKATVSVQRIDGHLAFEITDDGSGFDVDGARHGSGLQGMSDRVEALGGRLDVRSAPGRGTTIAGRVPVMEA